MLRGFKEFIMKGNVIDLAAAVIIGAAFGAIVDSLVKDVVTPILTAIGGQPDFSAVRLGPLGVGNFLNAVISFVVKAAGLYFLIVVPFGRLAAKMAVSPAPPSAQERYLKEIRDLLAQRR
ncbi:MAG: large conductance mechanosensitive channel protein MscL [Thermoanaerobaculia bacterium]